MGLIDNFENISTVETGTLLEKLANLPTETIVKARIGTSPSNAEFLASVFTSIDFAKERAAIGPIRIEEVEAAQQQVLKALNWSL